jgi:hypothetical protein
MPSCKSLMRISNRSISKAFIRFLVRSWVSGRTGFMSSSATAMACASAPPIMIGRRRSPFTSPSTTTYECVCAMLCDRATISSSIFCIVGKTTNFPPKPLRVSGSRCKLAVGLIADRSRPCLQRGRQFGNHLKGITHDPVIGCFEEGRFRIFIDHHNGFTSVYASKVLDSARNTNGNV